MLKRAKLKAIGGAVKERDLSIAKIPPKTVDEYYRTDDWRRLRHTCLSRDDFRCTAPGCTEPAVVADHIVSRKNGGTDDLSNLRSLCRFHDSRVKEDTFGRRRNGGQFQ